MLFAVCVAAAAITPRLRLEVTLGLADKASFVATYDATEAERAVSIASSARVRCCFALDGVHSGCTGFDAAWRAEGGLGLLARGEHALRGWVARGDDAAAASGAVVVDSVVSTFAVQGSAVLEARTTDVLNRAQRAALFDSVYENHAWACGADLHSPKSGCGSRPSAAAGAIEAVEEVVRTFDVRSILDLACGDHAWMRHVPLEALGVTYTGGDLSSVVIASNRAEHPSRAFVVVDAVADALPSAHELVLSRHMMYHVATPDVLAMLRNVAATRDARWLLATTSINDGVNTDLVDYRLIEGRPLNLMRAPFCLVAPKRLYRDEETDGNGNFLALWELRSVEGVVLPFIRSAC